MFDFIMTEEQKVLQEEMRDLVSWVPRQLVLDMDAMIAPFPKFFLEEAGKRNLLGLRFPAAYGGRT
jgi:butyryl-CoA dehydrogenase